MATPPASQARRRSPNYPVISLSEAITRIQKIYETQHTYPTNREALAKILGYGTLNGASASLISALSKYGLLEGHGDSLRVSELGQNLALLRQGDPEYSDAIREAAFTPTLFRELHEQYPRGLPSEHSLRVTLIKRGFNPKAVNGVIRLYHDTLAFVDAETDTAEAYDASEWTQGEQTQTPVSRREGGEIGAIGGSARSLPSTWLMSPVPETGWDGLVLWFKIAEDCEVRTEFKGRVTQEAINKFIAFLNLSRDTFPSKEVVTDPLRGSERDTDQGSADSS